MVVTEEDGKTLLEEFNKKFPHGFVGARRTVIISQIDNATRNIPPNIIPIFQRYTIGELLHWYIKKRESGEIK